MWPFSYLVPPMRFLGCYGNKFYNLYPSYPKNALNQKSNYWPFKFQEVKNVKFEKVDDAST